MSAQDVVVAPDMAEAIGEWRELMTGLGSADVNLRCVCGELVDLGLPVFCIKSDAVLTPVAGRLVVPYQLAERLKALLPAARAGDRHAGIAVEESSGH